MDGLENVKKLQAAVRRVAKKLGIEQYGPMAAIVGGTEDLVNVKFTIPAAMFPQPDAATTQTRQQFDAMMDKKPSIDMSAFEANLGAIGDEDE